MCKDCFEKRVEVELCSGVTDGVFLKKRTQNVHKEHPTSRNQIF